MRTGLKIISILQIIAGLFVAGAGALTAALFASGDTSVGSTVEMVALSVVLFVLEGALAIISGALGLRAARDPEKSMLAVIWGGLTLAISVFSLVTEGVQQIVSCIIPLLYFIFAMNVRRSRK
ncbi:MAG TPA: hypothetical protein H9981_10470 [Candidatus Mediterraneibacter caccavium]|uniref:Uncharacterized protein n=1 Tax=Candidatus Mediterraneibacter caccavium TaxID=2838661 RepID=A0A9D1W045_9FIRM|nr:hypothetical protein [Lachnoclostridium sp. An76]OUN33423.1 hypothetical protein B5G27_12350 [Lachnoclostridium sp. An76]HIX49412.1 hypothetical protein [Candidatus Mediterraneibacter caccavium]